MIANKVFRAVSLAVLAGWGVLIFWFSSQTAEESSSLSGKIIEEIARVSISDFDEMSEEQQFSLIDRWQTVVRKTAHFTEYAVLGVLAYVALTGWTTRQSRRVVPTLVGGLLYAVGDEFHQFFVEGRGPAVKDVLIDFCGVCAGTFICVAVVALRGRAKSKRKETKP